MQRVGIHFLVGVVLAVTGLAPPPGVPPIDSNGPSFFTALQEQPGLEVQSATAPVEVVVIDSVDQPTPD